MQIEVQTDTLRNALNKILSVIDKKSSRPILTYTLIEAKDNHLFISATNLEVSAKLSINADVKEKGTFCVNAKNIFDILRELPEGKLTMNINQDENTLKLHYGEIHFSLLIYKTEEFPQLVFSSEGNNFRLKSDDLSEIIQKTSPAISLDETRIHLNGIYLQEIDSKLRAVATDGHRLALYETEIESTNIDTLINGIIIPKKGVSELKKMAESYPEADITLSVDESFLYAIANEEYFLSIRLIAREYPKYQAVIPTKTTYTIQAERNALLDAVKRIKIMSNEKSNGVRLQLEENQITILANHPSLGNAMEKVSVSYSGKEMEIGFNARYLLDAISIFEEGEISIELNNELSPVILKSNTLPNYLGIIMPLRL